MHRSTLILTLPLLLLACGAPDPAAEGDAAAATSATLTTLEDDNLRVNPPAVFFDSTCTNDEATHDVTITNITMRDVTTAPLFLRIGNRARGPNNPPPGAIRRVEISNLTAYDADPRFASIIAGLPNHPVEDVRLSNIRIVYKGGGTREEAEASPPERESSYPEPSMFGPIPAYGFYVRHARVTEARVLSSRPWSHLSDHVPLLARIGL